MHTAVPPLPPLAGVSGRHILANLACLVGIFTVAACSGNSGGSGGGGKASADAGSSDVVGDGLGAVDAGDAKSDAGKSDGGGTGDATGSDGKDGGGDAMAPCTLPEEGICTGATVRWCDGGAEVAYDCKESDEAAVCGVLPDWGADCLLPKEAVCTYVDDEGDSAWAFCQGKDAGCVASGDDDDAYCAEGVGVCKDEDIDGCLGAHFVLDCGGGQALTIDCKASGGSCGDSPSGDKACIGVAKGQWCDDAYVYCAAGTKCVMAPEAEAGTCQ